MRSERTERRTARTLAGAVLLAGLFLAVPALASGDNIELVPDPRMLISLIVLFALLVFPVNNLLFKPIFAALDARDEKIAGTRARAEQLATAADEILARYQSQVREVREEAELERRQNLAEARSQALAEAAAARTVADTEIDAARREVASELARAREGLRREAQQLARDAAGRVLGRDLS